MNIDRMDDWTAAMSALPVSMDDQAVAELRAQAVVDTPQARAIHQTVLAWHLRQRNTAEALALAGLAEMHLPPDAIPCLARLQLVRAEAAWLCADMAVAEGLSREAEARFAAVLDLRGACDALELLGQVQFDQGDVAAARLSVAQARRHAQTAGDSCRAEAAQAVLTYWSLVDDGFKVDAQAAPSGPAHPVRSADSRAAMWSHDFNGQRHARQGRHSAAIAEFSAASECARHAGQLRRWVVACTNVAACWNNLNDHDSSIEWSERALAVARSAGWPASIGLCLMMTGNSLHLLKRTRDALPLLEEAITVLRPLAKSRSLLVARSYLADVLLDLGRTPEGMAMAQTSLVAARAAGMDDIACEMQKALAKALVQQGRMAEGAAAAEAALALAEGMGIPNRVIDALLVLAKASAPAAAPGEPPRAKLQHLQRALSLGAGIEGFHTPPGTFEAAARELALAGDLAQAYALMRQANAARDRDSTLGLRHRARALEVHRETQRLQAEAAALRQEAATAGHRAQAMQLANDTLMQLGAIGREITSQRELDSIFQRLVHHLHGSLDVQHLSIWLLDEDATLLHLQHGLEQGRRLGQVSVHLRDPLAGVARCARSETEFIAERFDPPSGSQGHPPHWPGTLATRSALFGPLRVAQRLTGVLCVQSVQPAAYGELQQLMFRSVCAWAAIALDNGSAVSLLDAALKRLQVANDAERQARAQAELATQLKGEFLANISHDLRTPLASLHGYLETLLLDPGQVSEAEQARYLRAASAQCTKVNRLAAELMELAQLESGAMQPVFGRFGLYELLGDLFRKIELASSRRSQRLLLNLPRGLPEAWADANMIERVLTNLIDNAIQHAPPGSEIRVEAQAEGDRLLVTVLDTGAGIPAELRAGLFARPSPVAQAHRPGGGGLGLLIVQRLLEQHGCEIRLVEREGFGAAFRFDVPCWREEGLAPSHEPKMTGQNL